MNLIKILLLQVLMLLFTPPAYARRVAECGVERYKSKSDPVCGAQYQLRRSPACEVEHYNEGLDMSCPGSQPEEAENLSGRTYSCSGFICSDGRRMTNFACTPGGPSDPTNVKPLHTVMGYYSMTCIKDAVPARCAQPQFGAVYKECRAPSHDVEFYHVCEREEFGADEYKDCAIRKTTDELVDYLGHIEPHIDMYGYNLISSHGDFMKVQGKPALGCFIAKYVKESYYSEIVEDLKNYFSSTYQETFDEKTFHPEFCQSLATSSQIPNIESTSCAESNREGACYHVNAYRTSKQWLNSHAEEISLLQEDIVARTRAELRNRMTISLNAIQGHLQKDQQFQLLGR
jgi:hypothetical protein